MGNQRRRNTRKRTRRDTRKRTRRDTRKRTRRNTRRVYRKQNAGAITTGDLNYQIDNLKKVGEIGRFVSGKQGYELSHPTYEDDRIDFRKQEMLINRINECERSKRELISELEDLKKKNNYIRVKAKKVKKVKGKPVSKK